MHHFPTIVAGLSSVVGGEDCTKMYVPPAPSPTDATGLLAHAQALEAKAACYGRDAAEFKANIAVIHDAIRR